MPKALVIYFSHTGKTKVCAEAVAKELDADLREVKLKKPHRGIWAYVFGGREALFEERVELLSPNYSLNDYDQIILMTPVWAWHSTPAMYTFANNCDFSGKEVFVLVTSMGMPGKALDTLCSVVEGRRGKVTGQAVVVSAGKSEAELAQEALKNVVRK